MEELPARNIHLTISMIVGQPPPNFSHLSCRILWLQTCDSIIIPIPIKELMAGVQAALPVIQSGQSILVYCAKGRHRSVAMAAAILIAMGYTAHEAMDLVCVQRPVADPQAWHIARRIRKFENCWQNRSHFPNKYTGYFEEIYSETTSTLVSRILLLSRSGQWALGKIQGERR